MKAMKGLSMNRVLGSIRKKSSGSGSQTPTETAPPSGSTAKETPEATAHNSVKAFCESGGSVKGDEVLFLPPIVDAAESSPAAAAECARLIRKFMSKAYNSRPSWQYNAIMLVRILTDNPGQTFTRNLDQKFVDTARALLINSNDPSVRQILMETMDDFENTKLDDSNLTLIITMWKREKEEAYRKYGGRSQRRSHRDHSSQAQALGAHQQNFYTRHHDHRTLPAPVELVGRLEEARTSAKLLEQVVMNTPPSEILGNELIREFADRCLGASRSIQGYMISQNPAPDNDTMESLIDTNEQLQTALNQHQRAMLNARKQLGLHEPAGSEAAEPDGNAELLPPQKAAKSPASHSGGLLPLAASPNNGKGKAVDTTYNPPPGPPPGHVQAPEPAREPASGASVGTSKQRPKQEEVWDDPFADPQDSQVGREAVPPSADSIQQRHAEEPFHPGGFSGSAAQGKGLTSAPLDDRDEDLYSACEGKAPARN